MHAPSPCRAAGIRRGTTLLEVLISCGLLIAGLSAIAALLPAAGSRLTQATVEDRAALLLSNAAAEIVNRGLLKADVFPAADAGDPSRTLAFGEVLGRLPVFGGLPGGGAAGDHFAPLSTEGLRRCGSRRTFVLEDVLVYEPPRFSDAPVNAFDQDATGAGPRKFREGICWGATLTPDTAPAIPGGRAVLAIAVFKRGAESEEGQLDEAMPFVLERLGGFYETEDISATMSIRGCSWLLAIPPGTTQSPRWFRVMSSWKHVDDDGRQTTRIILRNQQEFESVTGTAADGSSATVFAFEGIVRVEERGVTLN